MNTVIGGLVAITMIFGAVAAVAVCYCLAWRQEAKELAAENRRLRRGLKSAEDFIAEEAVMADIAAC